MATNTAETEVFAVDFAQLAREIAMDIFPLKDILELHKLTDLEWQRIQAHKKFQAMLADITREWQSALNTKERVRVKSATGLEAVLFERYILDIGDLTIPLNQRVEAGKFLARLGEMDGSQVIWRGWRRRLPDQHPDRRRKENRRGPRPARQADRGDPGGRRVSITYIAPDTVAQFMMSEAFIRIIKGPVGSGKTTGLIMEILRRSIEQAKGPDGFRRTRWAIVRQTLSQLKMTILLDILSWLRPIARYKVSEQLVTLNFNDVVAGIYLIPLEEEDDQKRLLSMQLTGCSGQRVHGDFPSTCSAPSQAAAAATPARPRAAPAGSASSPTATRRS
jgi:hypothetical protein